MLKLVVPNDKKQKIKTAPVVLNNREAIPNRLRVDSERSRMVSMVRIGHRNSRDYSRSVHLVRSSLRLNPTEPDHQHVGLSRAK
jgi:hypothetical protein